MANDNYDTLIEQTVEIRALIPENVRGINTESMICCPTEVLHFAKLYIEELQNELKNK